MLETRDSVDVAMTDTPFMSPSSSPTRSGDGYPSSISLSPSVCSPSLYHSPTPFPRHVADSPPSSPSGEAKLHLLLDDDNGKNEGVSFRNDGCDITDDKVNDGDEGRDEKMDKSDDFIDVIGDGDGDDDPNDASDEASSPREEAKAYEVGDSKTAGKCDSSDKGNVSDNDNNTTTTTTTTTKNSDVDNQQMSPTPPTNFSIAAILKPEFGTRKVLLDFRSLTPTRPLSHPHPLHPHPLPHQPHSLPHHGPSFGLHNHLNNHHRQQLLQHHQQRLGSSSPVDLTVRGRNANPVSEKQKLDRSVSLHTNFKRNKIATNGLKSKESAGGGASSNDGNTTIINGDNNNSDKKPSAGNSNKPNIAVDNKNLWPAWVFCTRYSDRPSSGPRSRKIKRKERSAEEKRPRTAFTNEQLSRLKREFDDCRYLTENRRRYLASELGLTEAQIKIWFQNKRAKIKKSTGMRNPLALQLMAQGLYNHSTVTVDEGEVRETDSADDLMTS